MSGSVFVRAIVFYLFLFHTTFKISAQKLFHVSLFNPTCSTELVSLPFCFSTYIYWCNSCLFPFHILDVFWFLFAMEHTKFGLSLSNNLERPLGESFYWLWRKFPLAPFNFLLKIVEHTFEGKITNFIITKPGLANQHYWGRGCLQFTIFQWT